VDNAHLRYRPYMLGYNNMADIAKLCGYRIYPRHFVTVRKISRKLKITEAEVVRRAIEYYAEENHQPLK